MLLIEERLQSSKGTKCNLCYWKVWGGGYINKSFPVFEQKLEGRRSCPVQIKEGTIRYIRIEPPKNVIYG